MKADDVQMLLTTTFNGFEVSRQPHEWGNMNEVILIVINEEHNVEVAVTPRGEILIQENGIEATPLGLRDYVYNEESDEQLIQRIKRMMNAILQRCEVW